MNRELLRKVQFPLMIALLIYPLGVLALGYADPALLKWRWLYTGLVTVFSCVAMPLPGKLRVPFGAACSTLLVLLSAYLTTRGADWKIWLLGAGAAAALMWSLKIGTWKPEKEMPPFWTFGGMAVQLGVRVIMVVMENTQGKTLDSVVWEMNLSFFVFVILAMMSMNRSTLNQAAMGRTAASRSMRRKNTVMILVVFVLALMISLLPVFVTAAEWAVEKIGQAAMWFGSLFGGDAVGELPPDEVTPPPDSEGGFVITPFVLIAGQVIALAIAAFISWQVFKALKEYIKSVLDRLGSFASDAGEDFVDEVTDIREEEDHQVQTRRILRSEDREMDGLSPVQQVRRQYRRLLRSHKDWGDARTARENIPDEMAQIYEQARYSGSDVTQEQAKTFRTGTKKI